MVTNEQIYVLLAGPMLFNALLMGVLIALVNAKFSAAAEKTAALKQSFDQRFEAIERRFDGIDRRFDDMRDLWRSELHRVEEVLDARLRHLEER